MLQNAEVSPVTLLNSVSITDAHPTISKILGTLTGNICSGVSFNVIIDGRLGKSICLKGTLLDTFFWEFSKTFKTTVFPDIH